MKIEGWNGLSGPKDYDDSIDDDPPYNRCPGCTAVIAAIVAILAISAGYGVWLAAGALLAWVWW